MNVVLTVAALFGVVGFVVTKIRNAVIAGDALDELESSMRHGKRQEVRALLIARGHLLPKRVYEEANVWLVEHDAEH